MKKIVFIVTAGVFGLFSCSPKFYSPNTQNVPLISEQGEVSLNVSTDGNQFEFQGAGGIANNFSMQLNGGLFIPNDLDNGNGGSGKFGELGLGYFTSFNEKWVLEIYGLGGIGTVENHMPSTLEDYPGTNGKISSNLLRVGVQPSFGFKSKYFTIALSSRLVNLSYDKIRGDLTYKDELQTDYLRRNSSHVLLEPALTIRGGFERIKLQAQYGYSFNLTNYNFRQEHVLLTVGVNFSF
ncbi:MAG TPA: hypothetical protein VKY37_08055 [Brumimicrobium sp.]|nr:hypothetical protein [Brumimicrobium sp.]